MTFEQIKELIELVSHNRLQGLELERSGFRLKIDGQSTAPAASMAIAPPAAAPAPAMTGASAAPAPSATAMTAAASTAFTAAPAPAATAAPAGSPGHIVNSPIVGTFYRAASPDTPPFCEIGSRVKQGQVLCIIEAMKLMNEIESDADGVIAEIYPQNAQAVEFGEPLFAIRPS
ncbi:MAG TPA: acetyl-CoA carboxylase biotin carboxyl carrier protein [Thermoanaerobaculia bacterium]|nr:acetyl-CoA carboxylase biotin carboxyl carrier protein [Thermoanaerobaculia bacterium]